MKRYIIALILLLGGYLSATTVTGTISDVNGNRYANGTVSAFNLITGASMTPAATDANGTFSITLSPSTYQFTVCAKPVNIGPNGGTSVTQVCAQPATPIVISGSSQDVSAQINAVAPILGPSVAALLGANNAFTGANTHAGLETFNGLVSLTNILTGSGSAAIAGTFGGSPTMTGNWTFAGPGITKARVLESTRFCDQYATGGDGSLGNPFTSPTGSGGIQECINDTPTGGTAFIPSLSSNKTYYSITSTAAEAILITKPISLECDNSWGSVLYVAASVPTTTDIVHVKGSSVDLQGFTTKGCWVQPASGAPGKAGLHLDADANGLFNFTVDHFRVEPSLSSYGLVMDNPSNLANGGVYLGTVKHSTFYGGMNCDNCGDSLIFDSNRFTTTAGNVGPNNVRLKQIGSASHVDGGAHGLAFIHNNVTTSGNVVVINVWEGLIGWNDAECVVTSTDANSTLFDIQGNATDPIQDLQIVGNYIGASSAFCNIGIRLDRVRGTLIHDNYSVQGGAGTGGILTTTINADRTQWYSNNFAPNGNLITSWLSDLGTNTQIDYIHPNSGFRVISPALAFGANGASNPFLLICGSCSPPTFKLGSTSVLGFASGSDPTGTGNDAALSRISAGLLGVGNGTQGDVSASIDATSHIAESNFRAKEVAAPSGISGWDLIFGDATSHTPSWNNNNNGLSSPSGAWQCTNITPVTLPGTSTTGDQNLMTCTIPAGTLNRVGRTLRVKVKGVYSTPAASTSQMTLKLKLCTVSGCGSGTVISPISIQSTALGTVQITNDNFSLRSEVTTQTAGASSAYEASGEFLIDLSTLTTAADSEFGDTNTATVGTIDSTGQLFIQTTIAFSVANASNIATQRQLIVETVN